MPQLQQQKGLLFFIPSNLHQNQNILDHVNRSGELKGRKILAKHQGMIANFKKRYGSRENLSRVRSSLSQEIAIEKKRIRLQNSKCHSLTKQAKEDRKNIIQQKNIQKKQETLKYNILSQKQFSNKKQIKLQNKMKEYLNLILKKNKNKKKNQIPQIKRSQSQIESNKSLNKFLRKMKFNQTKKKSTQDPQEYPSPPKYSYQIRNGKRSFSQLDDIFIIL